MITLLKCGDINNIYWGLGIGDWGLGIGDWGLGVGERGSGTRRTSQAPILNPQCTIPKSVYNKRKFKTK